MTSLARSSSEPSTGGQSTELGTLVVAVVFVGGFIWYGYARYALTAAPAMPAVLAALVGLVVAGLALLLARSTAAARVKQEAQAQASGRQAPWWSGWQLFLPLLGISALGAMNTMFLGLEGDDVLKTRVEAVNVQMRDLSAKGRQALAVPEVALLRERVEEQLRDLQRHVVEGDGRGTGNSCGIGQHANATLQKLSALLPGLVVRPRYVRTTDCQQTQTLKALYQELEHEAWARFASQPAYKANRMAERDELSQRLKALPQSTAQSLQQALQSSSAVEAVRPALLEASNQYKTLFAAVTDLSGKPLDLPDRLDTRDVMVMGNALHVLVNLAKRWDQGMSWLIVAAAVALDAWLVWAFAQLMRAMATPTVVARRSAPTDASEDCAVHYLWTDRPA